MCVCAPGFVFDGTDCAMVERPMTRQHHYTDFSSFQPNGWTPVADTTYRVDLVDDNQAVYASFDTTFIQCP